MIKRKISISIILILFVFLTSCSKNQNSDFDSFTEQLFLDFVTTPLDANFLAKDSEAFGFENLKVEPIVYSLEEYQDYCLYLKEIRGKLAEFNYDKLDSDRRLTYLVLDDYLEVAQSYEDYYYYDTPLGSYLGYQAQLPIILSEYHFYTKKDILDYFDYLNATNSSFKNILAFENEKANRGFGMNDWQIDGIISQCEAFLLPKENYLIPLFNQKIKDLPYLSLDEKNFLIKENEYYVKNEFLPAYQSLKKDLEKLKGRGLNNQGLSHFEKGKEYYEVLFRDATGTKMSVSEGYQYLEDKYYQCVEKIRLIHESNPTIASSINNIDNLFPSLSNEDIFDFFYNNYEDDFPRINDVEVRIENIHSSLEENSSPAMYFFSPIDEEVIEVIYVNDSIFKERPAYAFFTLAHEGIPGHLLQHSVLKNSDLPNIRKLINNTAYAEGWATYIERYVCKYLDIDLNISTAYHLYHELNFLYMCMADIGINYYGWSKKEFESFISIFGFSEGEIDDIYYQLIEVATNYLKYYFSYHQLLDLKFTFSQEALSKGIHNIDYEFHNFYLQAGPIPFHLLEKEMDLYLKNMKPNQKVRFFNEIIILKSNIIMGDDYEKNLINYFSAYFF